MNLETRKLAIIKGLLDVEDEYIIMEFERLLQKFNTHKQDISPMTKEDLIAKAQKTEQDISDGKMYSIEDVELMFKSVKNQ